MNPDELFTQNGEASSHAGGIAVAGDHVAIATSDAHVDAAGVGVITTTADAQSMGLDGFNFEMAGVSTLGVAGSAYGNEFSAGNAASYSVVAGPDSIDIDLTNAHAIGFGDDASVDAVSMHDYGALLPF